ncbi:MAG: hypothetical protein ACREKM_02100 [Longimicrobiales bacterium]
MAQTKLAAITELERRVQSVYGIVEQYAASKSNLETLEIPMKRSFTQLKMQFMGAGLDSLSQLAGSMEIASKRGMSQLSKARILREGVGSMKFQLELAQRAILTEEKERAREATAREEGA